MQDKIILDTTCGSRTIWFNKNHPNVLYCDKRNVHFIREFGNQITETQRDHVLSIQIYNVISLISHLTIIHSS